MKEITVENFNYSNVKEWIADYSHKEKVEFAVYCAELVIDLYTGTSEAPKRAIQAARDWILNPSEENKKKCKDAAAAAYAADAAADSLLKLSTDAAYAAAYAATDAAYAAAAAYAADAANAYAAEKSIKDKIISYINNKIQPQTKEVEWENGLPPVGAKVMCSYTDTDCDGWCDMHGPSDVIAYHGDYVWISHYGKFNRVHELCNVEFEKPETPEAKKEREEMEVAYHLYQMNNRIKSFSTVSFEEFKNKTPKRLEAWLAIVKETNYRVEK